MSCVLRVLGMRSFSFDSFVWPRRGAMCAGRLIRRREGRDAGEDLAGRGSAIKHLLLLLFRCLWR